ncbi:carbohydrate ABC transporter permease [Psychromonas sp. KJ10-10]|uniref:carbohydrate ABC transporter permease n=1 Tax=Psychromonas sp. KJ10-10 TaxID=3391823 RepID=UPI0039B6951A
MSTFAINSEHQGWLLKASRFLNISATWVVGILWILPLLYMFWVAFHSGSDAIHLDLSRPWSLENFHHAWEVAPFVRYLWNTFAMVSILLILQVIVCTLAAYALARLQFKGRSLMFAFVLIQLMVMPEALISENYLMVAKLGAVDTYLGISLPYIASAFGIFLLRQTFMQIPQELEDVCACGRS